MRAWFERATLTQAVPIEELVAAKAGRRIGVVLPARDEAATVGTIVRTLRTVLQEQAPLIDEIVVVDSRSSDDTAAVAEKAGAAVVSVDDVEPAGVGFDGTDFDSAGFDGGKGAALRTGLVQMTSDVGVFLDADVRGFDPGFVPRLVAPLLTRPDLVLVKAFYERPTGDGGGGRVTELAARPEIARRAPELSGFVQPLAGEVAFVRDAVLDLPVVSGYGVDIAMLLQTVRAHGLDATAQADLGRREHSHQGLAALGRMSLQVRAAFDLVLDGSEVVVDERLVPARGDDGSIVLRPERVETRLLPPPRRKPA